MENNPNNIKMTDEERLALAEKLDNELEEFIDGLEKKRYTDGWPEDRWQEEMDKHPFFMKKAPEPGDDVHPLYHGMQQLKYDSAENTADELAINYKEDGNFYMKHKKYRMSIYGYTEGIKAKSENPETNAILYNNRSAANFFLRNYRSSLLDAEKALTFKSDYHKAKWRAAQCAFVLNKFELCMKYFEDLIECDYKPNDAKKLLLKCKHQKLENERNQRKNEIIAKKKQQKFEQLIKEIQLRKIKFDDIGINVKITEQLLTPKLSPLQDQRVNRNVDGLLMWPAAFCYPEVLQTDFIQALSEDMIMEACINDMLSEKLPWDTEHIYKSGNLSVYYENRITVTTHKVNLHKKIQQIMAEPNFYVTEGSLLFFVVPTNSQVEKDYIEHIRHLRHLRQIVLNK